MRRLLFTRHYANYTGGHGKVFDYIQHADAHTGWRAHVHVHPASTDEANPFLSHPRAIRGFSDPQGDDALFLAGDDWQWMPPDCGRRVVFNLIQGIRHADPRLPLHGYLSRKAIRLCVSHAVAAAISATGRVNGPIHVIPAALSLPVNALPAACTVREGIFIYAHKQPSLGTQLAAALREQGHRVDLQLDLVDRASFLAKLARSAIAIPLPLPQEGFFLPGLEAMAMGSLLIGVDAGGNREYLRDGVNAIVAAPDLEAILAAVARVPEDHGERDAMLGAALETTAGFSLMSERRAFHRLLDDVEAEWAAI